MTRRQSTLRRTLRWAFIVTGSLVAVTGYWALANLQITLNGSQSLPDTAYLQWRWPRTLWHGAVVAVPPPAVFGHHLDGMSVVKRIGGLPGDVIVTGPEEVCVAGLCYRAELRDGRPFAPLLPGGTIPEGMVALFGSAPNSFDSRYASFGLVPVDEIEAVGIPLDTFPRWTELAAWLGTPS